MTDERIVSAGALSKRYKLYSHPWRRAAEWLSFGKIRQHDEFWALRDISFELRRGECLGIIGPNGAGKSTLLKILSRALYPTSGAFEVRGRAVSLLELGTGFNPQLSGIENIRVSARLLGFDDAYVRSRLEAIVEFSELGDFIDRPVRIYSSGMYVRLAFSLFAFLEPEVYIIDEALAVGDSSFQKKCIERLNAMRQRGVTILFVSHDLWRVEALCSRALYLEGGRVVVDGSADQAVRRYLEANERRTARLPAAGANAAARSTEAAARGGIEPLQPQFEMYTDSPLRLSGFALADTQGVSRTEMRADESFEVALEYECREHVREPVFRVVLALPDERRVAVVGWHPGQEKGVAPGRGVLRWTIQGGVLFPRRYVLHASVSTWDGVVYDTHHGIGELRVVSADLGPVFRDTDDLAACLRYSVKHEG